MTKLKEIDILETLKSPNDYEVFTKPDVADTLLKLLPDEIWKSKNLKNLKFLDPGSKSGVFLREIVKKLYKELKGTIENDCERLKHILCNQVYGIGITTKTEIITRRTVYATRFASNRLPILNGPCSRSYPNKCNSKTITCKRNIGTDECLSGYGYRLGNVCSVNKSYNDKTNSHDMCDKLFEHDAGNIVNRTYKHTYGKDGKCIYCGMKEDDKHVYPFIHDDIKTIFGGVDMKFDVIIGNPPYQVSDGGHKSSASPIYHKFVTRAIKLSSQYVIMVIPNRWFAGGKGLDEFRKYMINNKHIKRLDDYPDSSIIFPDVDNAGVCYFLIDKKYQSDIVEFVSHYADNNSHTMNRKLDPFNQGIVFRNNESISIYEKVINKWNGKFLFTNKNNSIVSQNAPFGIRSNGIWHDNMTTNDIKIYRRNGTSYINKIDIKKNHNLINKWKVLVPTIGTKSGEYNDQVIYKPTIAEPNSICSETYSVNKSFDTKQEAEYHVSYIWTRFFRFMVSLKKVSQNGSRKVYQFVPNMPANHYYTDKYLYNYFGLTQEEIDYIEKMIRKW